MAHHLHANLAQCTVISALDVHMHIPAQALAHVSQSLLGVWFRGQANNCCILELLVVRQMRLVAFELGDRICSVPVRHGFAAFIMGNRLGFLDRELAACLVKLELVPVELSLALLGGPLLVGLQGARVTVCCLPLEALQHVLGFTLWDPLFSDVKLMLH